MPLMRSTMGPWRAMSVARMAPMMRRRAVRYWSESSPCSTWQSRNPLAAHRERISQNRSAAWWFSSTLASL